MRSFEEYSNQVFPVAETTYKAAERIYNDGAEEKLKSLRCKSCVHTSHCEVYIHLKKLRRMDDDFGCTNHRQKEGK